ncbi:hypothetical protein MKX01_010018 [Papaver californicum]|nr:hypothetical protein MKX01_010018 [Papaver californicum]
MEISGVISRSYYGVGIDKFCVKSRKVDGISRSSVFLENGHLQYYVSPPMSEMGIIKKKLKLVKGLSKNLSMFGSMGFGLEMENGLISQIKGKNLEKQKSMKMKTESSSSSSESSDSDCDCGDVVNMKSLRINPKTESKVYIEGESTSPIRSSIQEVEIGSSRQEMTSTSCCSSSRISTSTIQTSSAAVMATLDGDRIEVCMGGKCKKSGAAELLQEFEKRVGGVEGGGSVAVVGCKCMGKRRDGPNVRVLNQCNGGKKTTMVDEIKAPLVMTNPLCIGVGLEDVSMIVANFFGNQERNDLGGLMSA